MELRSRSRRLFPVLNHPVKYSIRKMAKMIGISKSATHRHKKAIEKRNLFPESYLFETQEGYKWICRLFIAVIFFFAIKCGIGACTISEFFKSLRLDRFIGVSPTMIKNYINKVQDKLEEYEKEQRSQKIPDKILKIVGGVDETFFDMMVLVFMDLPSGYIFIEEASEDRCYDTWKDKVQSIIDKYGIKIKYLVSDRAKALIKLAEKGIGCLSIPDLFHASHEVVRVFGLSLNRKMTAIQKEFAKATATLALLKELGKDITQQEMIVTDLETKRTEIEVGLSNYHNILHTLSKIVHPFDISDSNRQSSTLVQLLLNKLVKEIRELQKSHGISDSQKRIEKFCKQIEGIASIIDAWWLWAEESLDSDKITEEIKEWLLTCLLPEIYWRRQAERTKNPDLKECYLYAFEKAQFELEQHPLTSSLIHQKEWLSWAEWMVSNFQRTSSAVEGRNGCLSQIHHNGRGLTKKRLKALNIIHNYYLKRFDGSTAAERLFGRKFADPFEWLVEHMGDLPLARTSKKGLL